MNELQNLKTILVTHLNDLYRQDSHNTKVTKKKSSQIPNRSNSSFAIISSMPSRDPINKDDAAERHSQMEVDEKPLAIAL